MIIADTSGVLAYVDEDEDDHSAVKQVVDNEPVGLVLSPLVLAEIDYMVQTRLGTDREITFLEDVALGRYTMASWDEDDLRSALAVVKQYRDLGIGAADASNVVLSHRYNSSRILTFDGHFRAVRPLNGADAFTLLPDDNG